MKYSNETVKNLVDKGMDATVSRLRESSLELFNNNEDVLKEVNRELDMFRKHAKGFFDGTDKAIFEMEKGNGINLFIDSKTQDESNEVKFIQYVTLNLVKSINKKIATDSEFVKMHEALRGTLFLVKSIINMINIYTLDNADSLTDVAKKLFGEATGILFEQQLQLLTLLSPQ